MLYCIIGNILMNQTNGVYETFADGVCHSSYVRVKDTGFLIFCSDIIYNFFSLQAACQWDYTNDGANWNTDCTGTAPVGCNHNKQSPIDIKETEKKLKKYVPLSKRQDKPDSVLWLIRNHPQLKDSQIAKLVGITKNSVVAIRNKSYWNFNSLNAKDPVAINLFSQKDLTEALNKAERRIKREKKLKEKAQKKNLQS